MAACGHFGCPKFTFDHISGHFRSIGHFGCLKITLDRISGHFRLIGHFGCPKFTFDVISGHFRSIRNFFFFEFFLTKWPPAAILDGTTMSIIELVRDIWMSIKMHVSNLKNPSKVIALTKLCGGGGPRGGCVADENIIFPKTYVSREYNYNSDFI